jgi:hypothetical protein
LENNSVSELQQLGPGVFANSTTATTQGAGTSTSTFQIEFTSASGGVTTSTTDINLSYCAETIVRSAAFTRAN